MTAGKTALIQQMEFNMSISLNISKGETISLAGKAPNLTKAIAAAG